MCATIIVTLKKAGLEDCAICHITGHKNTKSLGSYCGPIGEEKRGVASAVHSASDQTACSSSLTLSQDGKSAGQPNCLETTSVGQLGGEMSETTINSEAGMANFAFKSTNAVLKNMTFNFGNPVTVKRKSFWRLKKC